VSPKSVLVIAGVLVGDAFSRTQRAAWARIEPLMPQAEGRSRPWRDHRQVVEGIVFRYRTGVAWRDLPERFGPWQTVWRVKDFSFRGRNP